MYSLSKYSLSKYFILALLCLLISSTALAQSTIVSGQVTDLGGQSWNNGTFTFQFIPNNNFPSSTYSWTGGVLNQIITGVLNATGGYSQSVPSNTSITPSLSQWRLQVCSGTNPVNCFTVTQTITGGSQTVNVTPPPIVVPPGAGNTAYVTSEVSPAIVGSQIYIIGTGLQLCSTVSGGVCTVWTGGSSSSSPSSLATFAFNTATFGSKGDAISLSGCTTTSGSKIVTCPSGAFSSATDVGKITATNGACLVVGTSNPIASVQSATQVTLTNNANGSCGGSAVFSYGTNNLAAFTATSAAASTTLGGTLTAGATFGTVFATVTIPCGRFMIEPTSGTLPVFNFTAGAANGGQALVVGDCGGSGTEILAGEGWVFNTSAGGTLVGGTNVTVGARGFTVNGLNITFPGAITASIISVGGGGLLPSSSSEFLEVTNFTFAAGSPNLSMISCGGCILERSSAHDCPNAVGFFFNGDVITFALFGNNLGVGYHLSVSSARMTNDSIDNCTQLVGLNACMEIDATSNNVRLQASDVVVGSSTNGVDVNVTAGNRVTLFNNRFICGTGSGNGIRHISGDVHLSEQQPICGGSTSGVSAILNGANANLFDDGGNTWNGGSPNILSILSGTYIPSPSGIVGKCTGVATASQTLGLYNTGANVTASTCTSTVIGNGIPQTHSGSLFALYVTATAAGTNASSGVVTVLKNGAAQAMTCTVGTGTSCKDETHIISFVTGDLISIQFTTQAADTLAGVKATVAVQ